MQEAKRQELSTPEKATLLGAVPYGFLAGMLAEVGLQKPLGDAAMYGMLFTIPSLLCAVALFAPEEDSPRAKSTRPARRNIAAEVVAGAAVGIPTFFLMKNGFDVMHTAPGMFTSMNNAAAVVFAGLNGFGAARGVRNIR